MCGGDKLSLASCPTGKFVDVWNCSAKKEAVAWVSGGGVRWLAAGWVGVRWLGRLSGRSFGGGSTGVGFGYAALGGGCAAIRLADEEVGLISYERQF